MCEPGWDKNLSTGACTVVEKPCDTENPCRNNISCTNIAPGQFSCGCKPGYTGKTCEVDHCDDPCNTTATHGECTRTSAKPIAGTTLTRRD